MSDRDKFGPDGWPAPRLAWTAVIVLSIAQGVNAIDRHLINLLVGPIKADLQISDTQVGLLLGFAFALFYTFVGLPIGRLADTYSRKVIIACGATFWSAMTALCGLTTTFMQLFFARTAVGAGEASLNPTGYSMISDYFPPERRAKPMGVFIMGATLGSALVMFAGGAFVTYLTTQNVTWIMPWGQVLKPWQIAFVCAGLPGFLVTAMVLVFLREPPRRGMLQSAVDGAVVRPKSVPVKDVVAYLASHRKVYLPIFVGFGLVLMWHMGKTLWAPTYLIRTFGWTAKEAGIALGIIALCFTSTGALSGGWLADKLARRGYKDAHLRAAFTGTIIGLPFAVVATVVNDATIAMLLFAPTYYFGSFPFALAPAAISTITPNQLRGQLTALYLFVVNLLGFGAGPAFIGWVTDHVFRDEKLVGYSISLTAALAVPVALLLMWRAMGTYTTAAEEIARADVRPASA
jgi:MFS family permease